MVKTCSFTNQSVTLCLLSLLMTLFCNRVWALQVVNSYWFDSHCSSSTPKFGTNWSLHFRPLGPFILLPESPGQLGLKVTQWSSRLNFEAKCAGRSGQLQMDLGYKRKKSRSERYVFHRNVTFIDWEIVPEWLHCIPVFYSSLYVLVASEHCCQSHLCFTVWGFRGSSSSDRSSQWNHKTTQLSKTHWQNETDRTWGHDPDVLQCAITMNLSTLVQGSQAEKHKAVKASHSQCQTSRVLHCKHWSQWLFEGFVSWYQQQTLLFGCPDSFGQANLKMLLAVKAIDVLRGVWGLSSMWDGGSVCMYRRTCSCKSKRVCLQTHVFFGCRSNVWGSAALGMTLSHLIPPHPAVAWEWGEQ